MEVKKTYNPDISKVLQFIQERGFFSGFHRYVYDNYDIEHSLAIVEAIGRSRSPKFVIDDENRFAYANFIKWCHADPSMKALNPLTGKEKPGNINRGIYLAGNTGSGKSWCLEIMLAYAKVCQFKIRFTAETDAQPLHWQIHRSDDICSAFAEKGDISRFRKLSIIGIQDFGQEQPQETLYMGNRINVLQQLLEYRGDQTDEITLITSNLKISGEALKERYGDRVQSRLAEMCNYLEIKGKDRRYT